MSSDVGEGAAAVAAGLDEVHIDDTEIDDDNELALKGIVMLLNNRWDESRELFDKYKAKSIVMHYGGAFLNYVQAIFSLEEEKISAAKRGLEDVEKKCKANLNQMKRMKKKSKGSQTDAASQEDRWVCQIVVADSIFNQGVLTFLGQDIPSYVKGGLLLRKAWKIYDKVYKEISHHYEESKRHGRVQVAVEQTNILDNDEAEDEKGNGHAVTVTPPPASTPPEGAPPEGAPTELMTRETLSKLLGAVSFGYGAFQVALSMLPERVLKLIEFLGFHSNKETGLRALEFSMESRDMRAPLAVLTVLWYHVLMKPFFTDKFSDEEIRETGALIERHQSQYPQSAFFLFFKGRLCRLQKDIDGALVVYQKTEDLCEGMVELRNGAMFEIAWCNLMKLDFDASMELFSFLLENSKWSKCFYTYMLALCHGSKGNVDHANKLLKDVPGLVKKKTNQVEAFASRRAQQFKKIKLTDTLCELLVLELIYVWNNLPQCNQSELEKMLSVCGAVEEKKFFHLRSLVEGSLYKQMEDLEFSDQCFKEALARHEGMKYDYHVAAHALFERASYCIQTGQRKDEAKKMLLKAKDGFKEYDFENRLNVRIRGMLKTLEESK